MNKRKIKIISIVLLVILSILAVRIYLKLIYYPNNPTTYFVYLQRDDYKASDNKGAIELLEPPVGGCFDICWGKEEQIRCKSYSRKYDNCEFNCYGYVYNNCSSSKLGIIIGLLSR